MNIDDLKKWQKGLRDKCFFCDKKTINFSHKTFKACENHENIFILFGLQTIYYNKLICYDKLVISTKHNSSYVIIGKRTTYDTFTKILTPEQALLKLNILAILS